MDIDFSLVLLVLVLISGVIALLDRQLREKDRKAAADKLRSAQQPHSEALQAAIEEAEREPIVVEYAKSFFPVL